MLDKITNFIVKNETSILIGVGLAGFVSSTIAATKATPKAMAMRMYIEDDHPLEFKDEVKVVAKCYWPVALGLAASAACIIFAHKMDLKKNATILAAYTLSESRLIDYKKAVNKIIGDKDKEKIKDEEAKTRLNMVDHVESWQIAGATGDYLCFDSMSGQMFKSNIEKIRKAVNDLNSTLLNEDYVYLNDLYYNLGIKRIAIGDKLGWSMRCLGDQVDIDFSSQLTDNGEPCLVLIYQTEPTYIDVN